MGIITLEKELMLKALETLIAEICQNNFKSYNSVSSMLIKGFKLKQHEFLEYFGFHLIGINSFSKLNILLSKFKTSLDAAKYYKPIHYLTRDNWFHCKELITINSTDDIYTLISLYNILVAYLVRKTKITNPRLTISVLLSKEFIIKNDSKDVLIHCCTFFNLKVLFNKSIDDLSTHLVIAKTLEENYSQYFDRMTISWINRE